MPSLALLRNQRALKYISYIRKLRPIYAIKRLDSEDLPYRNLRGSSLKPSKRKMLINSLIS
jgi:hypothetical protein